MVGESKDFALGECSKALSSKVSKNGMQNIVGTFVKIH